MSINLYVQNYCQNCGEFEPNVKKITTTIVTETFQGKESYITRVYCKHQDRCKAIYEQAKREVR